jgi:hypothetical protein
MHNPKLEILGCDNFLYIYLVKIVSGEAKITVI